MFKAFTAVCSAKDADIKTVKMINETKERKLLKMKLFHISDLHIGKQLHYYNLKDLQIEILCQIVEMAKEHRPDVILIAGDIYDKSIPSGEAYEIFDKFLNGLADITPSIPVLIIAGNHDNAMRLKFASSFLEKNNIHISVLPPQNKEEYLKKITLHDQYGTVNFYMLPFTKPSYVRNLFEEGTTEDYNSAVKAVIERENIDITERNVLIAHQFFISDTTEPEKCDSEATYISVGGIDSVNIDCIRIFDYVALGHIHGAQCIGENYIRYSGTPLKYSVSEEHHHKGITVVTLGKKNTPPEYNQIPLCTSHDVRSITGTLGQVIAEATNENRSDYVSITLTDEEGLYRPKDQLDEHYDNILEVKIENKRTQSRLENVKDIEEILYPIDAFLEFYQIINNQPASAVEEELMTEIISEIVNIWE